MRREYHIEDTDGRAARLVIEPHSDAWRGAIYLPLSGPGLVPTEYGDVLLGHAEGDYEDVSRRGFSLVQALMDQQEIWERVQ